VGHEEATVRLNSALIVFIGALSRSWPPDPVLAT
jgi:hypothetical protein